MITTERLVLEPYKTEELPILMEIEFAPENCMYTWTNTAEEHEKELSDPNVWTLAVKRKEDGYIVGNAIIDLDYESEWMELKRIAFREKNQGYGREMITALVKHAFEEMKLNKVWLEAYTDNIVGNHLYESLGFHVDGILREHHKTERGILSQVQYSMLKGEYADLKNQGKY